MHFSSFPCIPHVWPISFCLGVITLIIFDEEAYFVAPSHVLVAVKVVLYYQELQYENKG
jgi:hypothetical protein